MDNPNVTIAGLAVLVSGLLGLFFGSLPAMVMAVIGLALWLLTKFDFDKAQPFMLTVGSVVTLALSYAIVGSGFLVATVVGILVLVVLWFKGR